MNFEIEEITKMSGDSFLLDYFYSKGELTIKVELTEIDQEINLSVKTNLIHFDIPETSPNVCFFEFRKLKSLLSTQNGYYIPSTDFSRMMWEKNNSLILAYGLKEVDFNYIFSLRGYGRYISFLVKEKNDIKVSKVK